MKRFGSIVAVILLSLPSLASADTKAISTSPEKELVSLLDRRYGDDYMAKLEKLAAVEIKLQSMKGSRIDKIKTLLGTARQNIILAHLPEYAAHKYVKSGMYRKAAFRPAYEELGRMDSRTDIHPFYLGNLIASIRENPGFTEDSVRFRALVYILFSLSERVRDNPDFERNTETGWKEAWDDAKNLSGAKISASKAPIYARILEEVARHDHINPYSQDDLSRMRETIGKERISPNSAYFKAYLSLRERLVPLGGKLRLPTRFTHSLQSRKLSCEANTATDLINFYRTGSNLVAMNESDFITFLPIVSDGILRTEGNFIWGDPNKYFVGSMDGKQSSNPNIFSGYGIYASGIMPIINHFLSSQDLSVQRGAFDERRILDSLSKKHPVMFWYLSAIAENDDGVKKYSTKPIVWKTPE